MKSKHMFCLALVLSSGLFGCATISHHSVAVASAPSNNEASTRRIKNMGLMERARHDFIAKLPDATINQFEINFVATTNVVWCTVEYQLSGKRDILKKDFTYQYNGGTNWILVWDIGR